MLTKITCEKANPQEWKARLPLPFKFGLLWARYAPRGRGAIPRLINKIFKEGHSFYIKTHHGAKLACWHGAADTFTDIAAKNGVYERFILDAIQRLLNKGDVFYDIGGNVGMMTIETAQIFKDTVEINCFEPQEDLASHIAISATLNGFTSISVFNCLLDESVGERELHVPAHSIHASLVARGRDVRVEKRAAYSLDDLVSDRVINPPQVIKIDVEGAEFRVFKGARKTIQDHHPFIVFEADSNMQRFGYSLSELMELLSDCAEYRYFLIEDDLGNAKFHPIEDASALPENINILACPEAHVSALDSFTGA